MPKTKVEVYDKDQLIYPFIESDHVTFSNGMKITEMLDQSISMPKVTHEDSSFKVGVGDQDVSSAIVDSSVADMTIKGQTYQNILPEPTLRNKMIGKSMQRLNEGYDNIEVVDGVSKSAILKGQTINNLWTKSSESVTVQGKTDDTTIELYSEQYDRVTYGETQVNAATTVGTKTTQLLQANKTYYINTFIFDADKSDTFLIRDIDNSINLETLKIEGYPVGQILSFTTQVETNGLRFYYFAYSRKYGAVNYGKPFYMPKRFIISDKLEDVVNQEFFEGMQSVKMPVLKTIGSNLISPFFSSSWGSEISNYEKLPNGYVLDNTINRISYCHNLDNLIVGKKYTFSCDVEFLQESSNNRVQVYFKGSGGELYGPTLFTNGTLTWTFTYNKKYNSFGLYFQTDGDVEHLRANITNARINSGETALTYEPYKTNILSTPEDLELRGIGDVKDELNVMTGELTQKFAMWRITAEGSHWSRNVDFIPADGYSGFNFKISSEFTNEFLPKLGGLRISCTPFGNGAGHGSANEGIDFHPNGNGKFVIESSKVPVGDLEALRAWLRDNPVYICYELATPIVKTVDLSSSGNWEKIVLNGSENWSMASESSNGNAFFRGDNTVPNNVKVNSNNLAQKVICDILTPFTQEQICNKPNDIYGISLGWNDSNLCVRHKDFPLTNEGLTQWKQYLQQNPVTVWYQTTTTQDNSIREMLSFANGHLQVSSEAENSLLPSVQYEIPTKNSYHMDLMKTNTLYTMKAKSVSGTFTIDGTSYNVNANGTFTSPSSMTDKLLVMSNKTNEEVMLLEGNVIDKTIPYFKGIKSAFEGEDKIEVLSQGKNLFNGINIELVDNSYTVSNLNDSNYLKTDTLVEEGKQYTLSLHANISGNTGNVLSLGYMNYSNIVGGVERASHTIVAIDSVIDKAMSITFIAQKTDYVKIYIATGKTGYNAVLSDIQLEESPTPSSYKPHKSNVSKIPLLSPLRSLPNGVCDELIIDRLNHKAKLIQRIGYEVLNENTAFSSYPTMEKEKTLLFQTQNANPQGVSTYCISDQFIHRSNLWESSDSDTEAIMIGGNKGNTGKHIDFRISKAKVSTNNVAVLQSYLSKEPIKVLYQLNTPIITEIDLEGYPYAYKDGHIFLNSDIAPTTQITYSINQTQQIESANENLQRHEKEISHLQKLIAQYIQVEYESTLLSLKI